MKTSVSPRNVAAMGSPIDEATFLNRAKARFGEKYDYTQIRYKSYKAPVKIRCLDHPVRDIVITPEKHLQTSGGCKFCLRAKRLRILEREFMIADAPDHPLAIPTERPALRPALGQTVSPGGSAAAAG
jgi:hypothetical protein